MTLKIHWVAAALLAATLGHAVAGEQPTPYVLKTLRGQFRDPASVMFFNLHYVPENKYIRYLCGEVNERNVYGGMTGRHPFSAVVDVGPNPYPVVILLLHANKCF